MSDKEYAMVKTIFDYIANSTVLDDYSSNLLDNSVNKENTNDSDYFQSILSDISKIKNST